MFDKIPVKWRWVILSICAVLLLRSCCCTPPPAPPPTPTSSSSSYSPPEYRPDPRPQVDPRIDAWVQSKLQEQQQKQYNDLEKTRECRNCGGSGEYRYVDGSGNLIRKVCPMCQGRGSRW